jgi:pyrroline-5-carboxylate reductase
MIYATDINKERLVFLESSYGISYLTDSIELFSTCDIIILAVKPQQINQVLSQISSQKDYKVHSRKLIVSIAAGISLKKIEDSLYAPLDEKSRTNLPVIRVMPNTPALVLAGMSGMSANRYASGDDLKIVRSILEAMGKVIEFNEEDLDAVTALSGSGPAYVFYFIEALIEGGIYAGLEPNDAALLAITTLKGSVKLMEELRESPEVLRGKVTSPGGTTEAALAVLNKYEVKQNIIEAIAAATRRSKELSG